MVSDVNLHPYTTDNMCQETYAAAYFNNSTWSNVGAVEGGGAVFAMSKPTEDTGAAQQALVSVRGGCVVEDVRGTNMANADYALDAGAFAAVRAALLISDTVVRRAQASGGAAVRRCRLNTSA